MMRRILFILTAVLLGLANASILINSNDHVEIFSIVSYCYVTGEEYALIYPELEVGLALGKLPGDEPLVLASSYKYPVYVGDLPGIIESNDRELSETWSIQDQAGFNLELAEKSGAKNFIMIDPLFAPNILSVLAYAEKSDSYILFANEKNIGTVLSFLKGRDIDTLIVFGYAHDSVTGGLNREGIQFTRIGSGDKYGDNVEIGRYVCEKWGCNGFLFTDSRSVEDTILAAESPILIVAYTVPEITKALIMERMQKGLDQGLLVVPEYTQSMYDAKMDMIDRSGENISIIVKIGKVKAAQGSGTLSKPDYYLLPDYNLKLFINEINYNKETGKYEIIIENTGEVLAHTKLVSNLYVDGEFFKAVSQEDFVPIKPGEVKAFTYDIGDYEGVLSQKTSVFYSSSIHAIEKVLSSEGYVAEMSYMDRSEISIIQAVYYTSGNSLSAKITNLNEEPVYLRLSVKYLAGDEKVNVDLDSEYMLEGGETKLIKVDNLLAEPTVPDAMNLTATYGGRQGFLEKQATKEVEINTSFDFPWWILLLLVIIIVGIILWYRSRSEKQRKEKAAKKK